MRKLRNILIIALTVALLAAGSLLPMTAAQMQDKNTANVVQYADIEALQLKLEEEVMSMTFHEKLRLLTNGTGVELSNEVTQISETDILEATNAALLPYMQVFFGKPLDNDYLHYNHAMAYDEHNPARLCYYWYVQLSLDTSYTDYISVVLDDESGKILAIEMMDPDFNIDASYLQDLQYNLAALYFDSLGLSPDTAWPAAVDTAPVEEGNVIVASSYQLVDAIYGEVVIEIGVHTDGFYIYIA